MMDPAGRIIPVRRHGLPLISMGMLTDDDEPAVLRGPMVTKYLRQFVADVDWGPLDWLVLDLPPGTGDVQLTLAQSFPLTGVIVVTTPQDAAGRIARRGARMFQKVNAPILGVVETMRGFCCPGCGAVSDPFRSGAGERLAQALDAPFLGAVPLDPAVVEGGDSGAPVVLSHPHSAAARAYRGIAAALAGRPAAEAGGLPLPFAFDWREGAGVRAEGPAATAGAPLAVERADGGALGLLWPDGLRQRVEARAMRLACGCALCVEEVTGRALLDPASVPADIAPTRVESVGAYGLSVAFSDGHWTGIYDWARLRALGAAAR